MCEKDSWLVCLLKVLAGIAVASIAWFAFLQDVVSSLLSAQAEANEAAELDAQAEIATAEATTATQSTECKDNCQSVYDSTYEAAIFFPASKARKAYETCLEAC